MHGFLAGTKLSGMKILFIGAALSRKWRGGEPRIAQMLASFLCESGLSVSKLMLTRDQRKCLTAQGGLRSLVYRPCTILSPEIDLPSVGYYRKRMKDEKPDTVITWFDFDLSASWASICTKIPTITEALIFWPLCPQITLFNSLTDSPCEGPNIYCDPCIKGARQLRTISAIRSMLLISRMKRLKRKLNLASAVVSDSQYLKDMMVSKGYRSELIHVIYNGVDVKKIQPSYNTQSEKIVLFLAGPYRAKGITHFIKLSEDLKPEFPDVRFLWVGQKQILGKAFEVRDYVWSERELSEIYNSAYLLLMPSLWPEPMSYTVQEAMAHGKPVVAYDVGANDEEVIHGETGFLAQWGNVKQLQSYVRELLLNEDLAKTMGQKARKLVEKRFRLEQMTSNYMKLIKAVSESHR